MKTVKQSFTLVEILVVIVIIGILSSFIFFTINDSVEKASIAKSKMFSESIRNNLLLNLVSEWKLDGNANDSWGSNDGDNNGAIFIDNKSQCISEGCVSFNGTNYIKSNNNYVLNGDATFSFWINSLLSTSWGNPLGAGTGDRWLSFTVYDTGLLRFSIGNGVDSWGTGASTETSAISKDEWYFLVGIRNSDTLKIYLNGEHVGIDGVSSFNWLQRINIGTRAETCSSDYWFAGKVDEVQIYDSALSESEIKQNYISGLNNLYAKGLITELEYNEKLGEL
jgi:prepilin-type N-terminal cleavage/methylation domain-containing protein